MKRREAEAAICASCRFAGEGAQRVLPIYLLSCLPLFYLAWMNRHYQLDDALIYLRYVRNFLASPSFYSSWGVLAIMPSILWCEPPWHLGSGRGASCKDMPVI